MTVAYHVMELYPAVRSAAFHDPTIFPASRLSSMGTIAVPLLVKTLMSSAASASLSGVSGSSTGPVTVRFSSAAPATGA